MKPYTVSLIVVSVVLAFAASAQAAPGNLILQVPNWNQPGDPANVPVINGYPGWCSPTAGGNLMGYWEDVQGCVGLTDGQVYPAGPFYPGTPGTWQQGLYQDGMIEMGWHMNTGNWQTTMPQNFPPNAGGTMLPAILQGLLGYAANGWVDVGTAIVKTAYPNVAGYTDPSITPAQTVWTNYCNEINLAHPVEVSFDTWVNTNARIFPDFTINGFSQSIERYAWGTTDPHSVVGVGYIDLTPGFQNSGQDEYFVCQDGWSSTGQYVAVPLDYHWMQNDYITAVPEPSGFLLLIVGVVSAMICGAYRRRMV